MLLHPFAGSLPKSAEQTGWAGSSQEPGNPKTQLLSLPGCALQEAGISSGARLHSEHSDMRCGRLKHFPLNLYFNMKVRITEHMSV